jgi:hypothetical protein
VRTPLRPTRLSTEVSSLQRSCTAFRLHIPTGCSFRTVTWLAAGHTTDSRLSAAIERFTAPPGLSAGVPGAASFLSLHKPRTSTSIRGKSHTEELIYATL